MFSWRRLTDAAAEALGEPVLASTPVSPRAVRAPGHGAWGHPPLTGAEVRLLAVTAQRAVIFALDRDPGGPLYYRLLRIEIERPRSEIAGVRLGRPVTARRFEVLLAGGDRWDLEVSVTRTALWSPVLDELGRIEPAGATQPGPAQPDATA